MRIAGLFHQVVGRLDFLGGLFFYMAGTALVLTPLAFYMTDSSIPVNWGLKGLGSTALIQAPNSVGALLLIYANRSGKAIIVVPMVNGLCSLTTIVLSLCIYRRIPARHNLMGMVVALIAVFLMAYDEVSHEAAVLPGAGVANKESPQSSFCAVSLCGRNSRRASVPIKPACPPETGNLPPMPTASTELGFRDRADQIRFLDKGSRFPQE